MFNLMLTNVTKYQEGAGTITTNVKLVPLQGIPFHQLYALNHYRCDRSSVDETELIAKYFLQIIKYDKLTLKE